MVGLAFNEVNHPKENLSAMGGFSHLLGHSSLSGLKVSSESIDL